MSIWTFFLCDDFSQCTYKAKNLLGLYLIRDKLTDASASSDSTIPASGQRLLRFPTVSASRTDHSVSSHQGHKLEASCRIVPSALLDGLTPRLKKHRKRLDCRFATQHVGCNFRSCRCGFSPTVEQRHVVWDAFSGFLWKSWPRSLMMLETNCH